MNARYAIVRFVVDGSPRYFVVQPSEFDNLWMIACDPNVERGHKTQEAALADLDARRAMFDHGDN